MNGKKLLITAAVALAAYFIVGKLLAKKPRGLSPSDPYYLHGPDGTTMQDFMGSQLW